MRQPKNAAEAKRTDLEEVAPRQSLASAVGVSVAQSKHSRSLSGYSANTTARIDAWG
jgi:hypothetical protein